MNDDPRLNEFTIRLALLAGSLIGMWIGWYFVIASALLAGWSAYRYVATAE